ncbi:MAG: D-tyrosyl-tRNA(Tyr) deacylase [Bacteroidia bacterium]|nr:D-tyrosyl-tRNA(Tyr) deacylase [Bacteroidia bacterium]
MRAVVQRVKEASITVNDEVVSAIDQGLLVLLGVEEADGQQDADWLAGKIARMRIFDDTNGVMNESVKDKQFGILVVSQFTLHASTKKGNRPSYIRAARPEQAEPLYEYFATALRTASNCDTQQGVFGANMQIRFTNDGPVTILLDSIDPE